MGSMSVPICDLLGGKTVLDGWFKLLDQKKGEHFYTPCPTEEEIEKGMIEKLKASFCLFIYCDCCFSS
jgi:hypothetical protein